MRWDGRRSEGSAEAVLEVDRVIENSGRKLRGRDHTKKVHCKAWSRKLRGSREASTFSAVPSSRRSKEHDAAMMAALLREVV